MSRKRRSRISWITILVGFGIGLALALIYTWVLAPVIELNTDPAQLSEAAKTDYLVAVSLAYRADSDLRQAVDRLLLLGYSNDPFQVLADRACDLYRQGVTDNSTRNAIEAMINLYHPQGRTGCADASEIFMAEQATPTRFPTAIPVTPTLQPPATKTPTLAAPINVTPPTVAPTRAPTTPPQANEYLIAAIPTYCSVELAGIIEVYVQIQGGGDIPGVPVLVRWDGGTDRFFTGLKPERGAGYADFQMDANRSYTVEIPGRSPRTVGLSADPCTTENGQRSTTSYRVIFRRN